MSAEPRQLWLRAKAETDLEEIWLYTFERWSQEPADKYVKDIISTLKLLAKGTKAGRQCLVRNDYFQYSAGSHIVFYRSIKHTLEVVRILHQRMDIELHLLQAQPPGGY